MTAERSRLAAPFRRAAGAWLAAALLLAAPGAAAQGRSAVSAMPVQGLRFGVLAAGTPAVVSPLDAGRRATLELVGAGHVTVTFELPAALTSGVGSTLPLRFGPGDGRVVFAGTSREIVFDPNQPVSFTVPPGLGSAAVYLGGAAQPAVGQPPGEYTATITVFLVVANTST